MKVLLLGEYSNVHATLARGLRELGHEVVVASDGDGWKNYPRDIDLSRRSKWLGGLQLAARLMVAMRRLRGFDVVQLINPLFAELKAERMYSLYRYLRQHNGRIFLGAYGMDYYWMKSGADARLFRYSDFQVRGVPRDYPGLAAEQADWLDGDKGQLNRYVAADVDGIIAGLYEYYVSYRDSFPQKLTFIPFPIVCTSPTRREVAPQGKIRFFIGVQPTRDQYKGTDVMWRALQRVANDRAAECKVTRAEAVPFAQYEHMMNGADVLLDQLYGYAPGMNALQAMEKGVVVVGGGEPEAYQLLGESELFPIVNVEPTLQSVERALHGLLDSRSRLARLSSDSQTYVRRHHDYLRVAKQYLDFWQHGPR